MRCLFLLFALTFAHLQADQIVLDDVMSKEDQQKAGINKLTPKEKIALESWLGRTFVLKAKPQEPEAPLSLSININNGKRLQLSDNSIWEIAPSDVSTSAVWITPFPVKIIPSNDPVYPYQIVNETSGASVKARKISPSS